MIEKEVLTSKPNYFATLLNGPMAKELESDGSLAIDEQDHVTFKALLFLMREEKMPPTCESGLKLAWLEVMASFDLVEYEFKSIGIQKLYIYETARYERPCIF
jgi:hypothetical protein